jgi:myo-inositol-1(or 4)-monophosphatase
MAGRISAREKAPSDLVTEADLASQETIREILLKAFPEHGFLAEEDTDRTSKAGRLRWIVDPLDGTMNYVHGMPHYSVSIALAEANQILVGTVYDPVIEMCYTSEAGGGAFCNGQPLAVSDVDRLSQALVATSFPPQVQRDAREVTDFIEVLVRCQGIRRLGSAAINLCLVASGNLDAYWATSTHGWDIAAGMLIVREAGGIMTDLQGAEIDLDRPHFLAASTAPLHAELLGLL